MVRCRFLNAVFGEILVSHRRKLSVLIMCTLGAVQKSLETAVHPDHDSDIGSWYPVADHLKKLLLKNCRIAFRYLGVQTVRKKLKKWCTWSHLHHHKMCKSQLQWFAASKLDGHEVHFTGESHSLHHWFMHYFLLLSFIFFSTRVTHLFLFVFAFFRIHLLLRSKGNPWFFWGTVCYRQVPGACRDWSTEPHVFGGELRGLQTLWPSHWSEAYTQMCVIRVQKHFFLVTVKVVNFTVLIIHKSCAGHLWKIFRRTLNFAISEHFSCGKQYFRQSRGETGKFGLPNKHACAEPLSLLQILQVVFS